MKRSIAFWLCLLALGAMAPVALAQSAGDQQYTDPFEGQEQAKSAPDTPRGDQSQSTNQTGSGSGSSAGTSAPSAQTTATRTTSGSNLAYTGFPAGLIALLGACALVAGLAIRVLAGPAPASRRDAVLVLGRDVLLAPRRLR